MQVIDLPGTHDTLIEQAQLKPALRAAIELAQQQAAGAQSSRRSAQ